MSDKSGEPNEPTDGNAITSAIGAADEGMGTDDLAAVVGRIEAEPDGDVASEEDLVGDLAELTAETAPLEAGPEEEAVGDEDLVSEEVIARSMPGDGKFTSIADGPPIDIIADEEELIVPTTDAERASGDEVITETAEGNEGAGSKASGVAGSLRGLFGRDRHDDERERSSGDNQGRSGENAGSGILQGARGFFDPAFSGIDTRVLRTICLVASLLLIALLLGNQAGGALILASALIPILIVAVLSAHDVYERESPLLLSGVGIAGVVTGILVGFIASWAVRGQWFDIGHLNFGAGGFGGHFAPDAAPWLVWLVVGILLPAVIVVGLSAAPLLLRRWPQFANEVMDGMILAGTAAAGLSIGLAATFWWPMVTGDGPLMNVRDWTLTILGQVFLRPLVMTLSGALIGAGVWRYMLNPKGSFLLLAPAVVGMLGIVMLWMGSLVTQPGGIWPEFVLTLALAVLVFGAYRRTLDLALSADRLRVEEAGSRMVCPSCHQVTPAGEFCARCGAQLSGDA